MGDKKYFPMLLEIAKKLEASQGREYVLAAAELGGDDAVPYLKELLTSADANARANGVMGLGVSGSRAAVPLLIDALKGGNADFGKLAENGLTGLTHRRVSAEGDAPPEQARKWATWWGAEGSSAKVYGPRECGEVEVLP
jgi:HEAT repeat protein